MKTFSADMSQLVDLEADLRHAETVVVQEVHKVVQRGSLNIKRDWQQRWSGLSHLKNVPPAITYDTEVKRDTVVGDIGPDKARKGQAPYATILEYGTPNNAPRPGGAPALEAEEPRFESALADLIEKLVAG